MSERAEADTVAFEVRAGVAWVKFNRPEKRNCISPKLNRQMLRVLDGVVKNSGSAEIEIGIDEVRQLVGIRSHVAESDGCSMAEFLLQGKLGLIDLGILKALVEVDCIRLDDEIGPGGEHIGKRWCSRIKRAEIVAALRCG